MVKKGKWKVEARVHDGFPSIPSTLYFLRYVTVIILTKFKGFQVNIISVKVIILENFSQQFSIVIHLV